MGDGWGEMGEGMGDGWGGDGGGDGGWAGDGGRHGEGMGDGMVRGGDGEGVWRGGGRVGEGEGMGEGLGRGLGGGGGVGGLDIVQMYNLKVQLMMTYCPKGQGHPAGCSLSGPKLRECTDRFREDCSILKITNDRILRFFDI